MVDTILSTRNLLANEEQTLQWLRNQTMLLQMLPRFSLDYPSDSGLAFSVHTSYVSASLSILREFSYFYNVLVFKRG